MWIYRLLVCGFELMALLAFGLGLYVVVRILWAERKGPLLDYMPGTWDFTTKKAEENNVSPE